MDYARDGRADEDAMITTSSERARKADINLREIDEDKGTLISLEGSQTLEGSDPNWEGCPKRMGFPRGGRFRDEQAQGASASSLSDKITAERQNEISCLYS